jgi:hypothetical protein
MDMFVCYDCLCCQVEVSATGRSLAQRSPTDCGVCLRVIQLNNLYTYCEQVGRREKDYETNFLDLMSDFREIRYKDVQEKPSIIRDFHKKRRRKESNFLIRCEQNYI